MDNKQDKQEPKKSSFSGFFKEEEKIKEEVETVTNSFIRKSKRKLKIILINDKFIFLEDEKGNGERVQKEEKYKTLKVGDTIEV